MVRKQPLIRQGQHLERQVSEPPVWHDDQLKFKYGLQFTHDSETLRAFWLPITLRGPDVAPKVVAKGTDALINHF